MNTRRYIHTAYRVAEGTVMVFGGSVVVSVVVVVLVIVAAIGFVT